MGTAPKIRTAEDYVLGSRAEEVRFVRGRPYLVDGNVTMPLVRERDVYRSGNIHYLIYSTADWKRFFVGMGHGKTPCFRELSTR